MVDVTEKLPKAEAQLTKVGTGYRWHKDGVLVHLVDKTLPIPGMDATPAWYMSNTDDISLSLPAIFKGDDKTMQAEVGKLAAGKKSPLMEGFLSHEMSHAAHSGWLFDERTPGKHSAAVNQVMTMFEELRIEKAVADAACADNLRPSFQWLLENSEMPESEAGLAQLWALTYGRYLAGIASRAEVEEIHTLAKTTFGNETVALMVEILSEAMECKAKIAGRIVPSLAQEWIELLDLPDEPSEGYGTMICVHADENEGDEGDGEGSGAGGEDGDEGKGSGDEDSDGDEPDETAAESGYSGETKPLSDRTKELLTKAVRKLADNAEKPLPTMDVRLADPRKMAPKVFGEKLPHFAKEVDPTPKDRSRALRLAHKLEQLALPSIQKMPTPSTIPPGRLRGREMVRLAADRDAGRMSTATPWEKTKRTRTTTRPVIVGCMTDTSGSMSWAQEFVADFAWVVARAGVHVGARTAAVTFGDDANMVHKPGTIPTKKVVYPANGGTEQFDHAIAALDGVLHLTTRNNSAKVLFIVTDGELVKSGEPKRAKMWLDKLVEAGTAVVWVGASSGYTTHYTGKGVTHVPHADADTMFTALEKAVVNAASALAR